MHQRTAVDDILILACDGLWDVLTSSQAVELAREIMFCGECCPMLLAEEMIDDALDKGNNYYTSNKHI